MRASFFPIIPKGESNFTQINFPSDSTVCVVGVILEGMRADANCLNLVLFHTLHALFDDAILVMSLMCIY